MEEIPELMLRYEKNRPVVLFLIIQRSAKYRIPRSGQLIFRNGNYYETVGKLYSFIKHVPQPSMRLGYNSAVNFI